MPYIYILVYMYRYLYIFVYTSRLRTCRRPPCWLSGCLGARLLDCWLTRCGLYLVDSLAGRLLARWLAAACLVDWLAGLWLTGWLLAAGCWLACREGRILASSPPVQMVAKWLLVGGPLGSRDPVQVMVKCLLLGRETISDGSR